CVTVGTEDFDLQVQETDGSWTEVLHSPQSTEVYVLVPGQTVEIVTEIPGRAPPAHYRYLKPVLVIGEPGLTLDAELDVVAPPDAKIAEGVTAALGELVVVFEAPPSALPGRAAPIAPPRSPSVATSIAGGRPSWNRCGCIAVAIRSAASWPKRTPSPP